MWVGTPDDIVERIEETPKLCEGITEIGDHRQCRRRAALDGDQEPGAVAAEVDAAVGRKSSPAEAAQVGPMIERVCVIGGGVDRESLRRPSGTGRRRQRPDAAARARGRAERHGLRVSGRSELRGDRRGGRRPGRAPASTSASSRPRRPASTPLPPARGPLSGSDDDDDAERPRRRGGRPAHGDWPIISAVTFMSGTATPTRDVEYILDTETWLGPYGDTPLEASRRRRR